MAQTLEEYLSVTKDETLLSMYEEIHAAVIPATSVTQDFRRKVNRMIDKGELCINPTTYRKVYLPTLVKAVQKELARRYVERVLVGTLEI